MWRYHSRKIDTQFNFTLNLASRQSNHICDKDAIEIYAKIQWWNKNKVLTEKQLQFKFKFKFGCYSCLLKSSTFRYFDSLQRVDVYNKIN